MILILIEVIEVLGLVYFSLDFEGLDFLVFFFWLSLLEIVGFVFDYLKDFWIFDMDGILCCIFDEFGNCFEFGKLDFLV